MKNRRVGKEIKLVATLYIYPLSLFTYLLGGQGEIQLQRGAGAWHVVLAQARPRQSASGTR